MLKEVLFLFDIDGTLMTTGGAGMRAFKAGAEAALAVPVEVAPSLFAGKLDWLIFKEMHARLRGGDEADLLVCWDRFKTVYIAAMLEESKRSHEWVVFDGVYSFVEQIKKSACMGLLTGNIREGAKIKLEAKQLWNHFFCGGFGEAGEARSCVAKRALSESEKYYGQQFNTVWVVGDTVADVECGKAIGAKVLAVRTGHAAAGTLEVAGADLVVDTLAQAMEESCGLFYL